MADRLAEIQKRVPSYRLMPFWQSSDDIDWLVAEVERWRNAALAAATTAREMEDAIHAKLRDARTEVERLQGVETAAREWEQAQKAVAHIPPRYRKTSLEADEARRAERYLIATLGAALAKPPTA